LIETLGYDFNAQNKDKDTPLHLAFHCLNPRNGGDISVLRYLLTQKGINGNIVGKHGDTLLHHACKHINILPIEIFQHLIENGGCDVNAKNSTKDHPLHFAFHHFNPNGSASIAALTYLLTREGIDGHVKDKNGDTFLHLVCKRIRILPLEVFQHLIENGGCDVNALNNNKNTPIHVAFHSFNLHRVDDIAILTYLLTQKGIDSHVKDIYGDTFLHLVCRRIRIFPLEVFQHLIGTIGCDVNAQNRDSDTPIHIAFHCLNQRNGSDINVWAYLINQKNLNVNIKNSNGHALLHLACISGKDSKDDFTDSDYDYMDSEDDSDGPEGNLDNHRETKAETFLCQIVEVIVERCAEQIFDEGVL
jgi:ankyrin repeat protein